MAQIDEELAKLKQTKADIAKSITDKGGVLENPSNFSSYNLTINKLNDFSVIGYESTPDTILNLINYSKMFMGGTDLFRHQFQGDKKIYYFPVVDNKRFPTDMDGFFNNSSICYIPPTDLTHVTNFYNCFSNCTNLQSFDFTQILVNETANFSLMFMNCSNLEKVILPKGFAPTSISGMFSGCQNSTFYLVNLDSMDFSKVTDISYFLRDTHIGELPVMNTSSCTNFENMLGYNNNIDRIEGLDISNGDSIVLSRDLYGFRNLQYMLLKGLGSKDNLTRISLNWTGTMWGSNRDCEDAKQSLVDTLITYSADRTGKETATIILRQSIKDKLTADEIAQIEAKNYTIEINDSYIE